MILVVDDDRGLATTLKLWLENAGYVVETASDGGLAYAAANSSECECILLDINMPHFNGPSLLLVLQSEGNEVPVIIITGEEGFTSGEMEEFENVTAFLEKPIEADVLLNAVAEYARAT